MEYSWKIENIDDVTNTMTVKYLFNSAYQMEPVLVNMTKCPAGVLLTTHIKNHVPASLMTFSTKYDESVTLGTEGVSSIYIENYLTPDTMSLDDIRRLKLEEIATERYKYETSGVYFSGSMIDTTRESQAILSSAYISLKNGLITFVDWKDKSGNFVTLGLTEIEAISSAVSSHVQSAFTKEKTLTELVLAAQTKEEINDIKWV